MSDLKFSKPRPRILEREDERKQKDRTAVQVRRDVRERDGHRCRCCHTSVMPGSVTPRHRAEVHHLVKRSQSKALQLDMENQVLLCGLCHAAVEAHEIDVTGRTASTVTFRKR
jgi:5-methylcytosine-specific restriction endonuclease McrA